MAEASTQTRFTRIRATESFRLVLALVAGGFVFAALAPTNQWTASVALLIQGGILAVALLTSGLTQTYVHAASGATAVAVVGAVAELLSGSDAMNAAIGALSASLAVATAVVIALGVARRDVIDAQSVRGAICVYILIGMIFIFVYTAVGAAQSGPFFAQSGAEDRPLFLYFSFVTLATLGYGDYTPIGEVGRMLAVSEALLGQLYLVTIVAVLVSRIGLRRER